LLHPQPKEIVSGQEKIDSLANFGCRRHPPGQKRLGLPAADDEAAQKTVEVRQAT